MGSVFDHPVEETIQVVDSEEIKTQTAIKDETEILSFEKKYRVVFVLGGPGGGKSTQCAKISEQIGFTHLSSGELLRKAMESDLQNGPMMKRMIDEGESVPPELTMEILMKAMVQSGNDKFLLDGFPRDEEIRVAFEAATKIEPELVLFFDCSEEEREKRILSRKDGRVDDNPEILRKRFKHFQEHMLPVVEYYRAKGKVYQVDASQPKEEVFKTIRCLLAEAFIEVDKSNEIELEQDIRKIKIY